MKIKWDGPRIKKNCLPVSGVFIHPIGGQIRVLVNPNQRKVSMITINGQLFDTFNYSQNGQAITTKRLATMLQVRGLQKA